MLGYIAAGFALGGAKALVYGSKRGRQSRSAHALAMLGADAFSEEVIYRTGVERLALRNVMGVEPARLIGAALFGLGHANPLDAAVGGYLYSRAYDVGGLGLSTLAHLAHNIGVVMLSKG